MALTTEQKEQLLLEYDNMLWSIVHRFKNRMHTGGEYKGFKNDEDLHSECVLVLVRHLNACETVEDVKKIPKRDMIHAMCLHILTEQALSYPKRTTKFGHIMGAVSAGLSRGVLEDMGQPRTIDDMLDEVAFEQFRDELDAEDKEVLDMKAAGCKNREVAKKFGYSDAEACRRIACLRRAYHAAMS